MSSAIAAEAYALPGSFHKDPVDRVLVATARLHNLTLVTAYDLILRYGHVKPFQQRDRRAHRFYAIWNAVRDSVCVHEVEVRIKVRLGEIAETSTRDRRATQKRKAPPLESSGGVLATSYSRTTYRRTTIGAAAFNFRVRNGNGWFHCARIARTEARNFSSLGSDGCSSRPVAGSHVA